MVIITPQNHHSECIGIINSCYKLPSKKRSEIVGIGLHKGHQVTMCLKPAKAHEGITFYRSDRDNQAITLSPDSVSSTKMATTIGTGEVTISTIEHLMSAIYAYGIDNLHIYVDSHEVPILDGSSKGFCLLFDEVGLQPLDAPKEVMKITETVIVYDEKQNKEKFAMIEPYKDLVFDFTIDFDHPAIKKQHYLFQFSTKAYNEHIAQARTFGFLRQLQEMRANNLAIGADLDNAIGLDDYRVLNDEGLRYDNEFVRHKILDAIGDLAILGKPIIGKYSSFAGSHELNAKLTRNILKKKAYKIITSHTTDSKNATD